MRLCRYVMHACAVGECAGCRARCGGSYASEIGSGFVLKCRPQHGLLRGPRRLENTAWVWGGSPAMTTGETKFQGRTERMQG